MEEALHVGDLGVTPLRHTVLMEGVLPEARDPESWTVGTQGLPKLRGVPEVKR